MPIILPVIRGPEFLGMTACGRLTPGTRPMGELFHPKDDNDMLAQVDADGRSFILHSSLGTMKTMRVHIDFVDAREFYGAEEFSAPDTETSIQSLFDQLVGFNIVTTFFGRYRLAASDVTDYSLTKRSKFKTNLGSVSISVSETVYSIQGAAPIEELRFKIDNDKRLLVEISGEMTTGIDRDYLCSCYKQLDSAFDAFVLGGG
jgi:hypothetical protein